MDSFGSEIAMSPAGSYTSEVSESTYRTRFGTGNVVVTLTDGTETKKLDQKAGLRRATNDTTSGPERYLVFRIGLQGGHLKKDRYSTPTPDEGIGNPAMAIPFPGPEKVWNSGDPSPPVAPSLEVVEGSVDENLDMLPGAHVILHLHVSSIPLINMTGPNAGNVIGTISIGDIEFTFPE
jgi:hypothetical protein